MPIKVNCQCGNKFAAPSKYAGKKVKCPKCAQPLVVPSNGGQGQAKKAANAAKVSVSCNQCGKSFSAKQEWVGKTVRCPACESPIKVTVPGKGKDSVTSKRAGPPPMDDDAFADVGLGASQGEGRRCPECRSPMSDEAILCIQCGYNENLGRKMAVKRPVTQADREQAYQDKILTGDDKQDNKRTVGSRSKSTGSNKRATGLLIGVVAVIGIGALAAYQLGVFGG